jgi:hypothetical protein
MCKWVLLPDANNPTERNCSEGGTPYCADHDAELHWHTWRQLEAHEKSERLRQKEEQWRMAKRLIELPQKKINNTVS